ncbi:unnamed protein product [Prunus armeniaca]
MAMGFGHNEWRRKCIREHKRYNEIERALNYFDDGFAPFFCWMTMPDMGHIIATFQSSETKLNEIAIGFVDDDHYVQVHLSPDHPIPPVSRMWHEASLVPLRILFISKNKQY